MTQKDLINTSLLPERTVRYALNILLKKGIITPQPHFTDARQSVYGVWWKFYYLIMVKNKRFKYVFLYKEVKNK